MKASEQQSARFAGRLGLGNNGHLATRRIPRRGQHTRYATHHNHDLQPEQRQDDRDVEHEHDAGPALERRQAAAAFVRSGAPPGHDRADKGADMRDEIGHAGQIGQHPVAIEAQEWQ